MAYALIENGEVIEGPLTRDRIAEIIKAASGAEKVTVAVPQSLDGMDLTEFGILPIEPSEAPATLPGQTAIEALPIMVGGKPKQSWTLTGELHDIKTAMLAVLATRRWEAEEAGTTVGALQLATDRVTQAKLTAAYLKASTEPDFTIVNWKMANGQFVSLDAAAIIAAGDALTAHVQACFDREAALAAEILGAGEIAELEAIDLDSGWPE